MARYLTTLFIPVPVEQTFGYVSDFSNATWDPRVSSARRTDGNGPLGVGSTFVLVSPLPIGSIDFHYRIIEFDPPRRVRLEGATWFARYRDELTLTPDRSGTSLRYDAKFSLRGLLRLGNPIMRILFNRIGADATRGIPDAVVRGTSAAAPPA